MKKLISLLLVFVMLLSLTACGNNSAQEQPNTEVEEPFVTNTLIKDGACSYTIVHDGTSETQNVAGTIYKALSANFGVSLSMASAKQSTSEFEIVVGKARPSAETLAQTLRSEMDFAIKVEEKALVLVAADAMSYQYMAEYLAEEVFAATEDGQLVMDSDDNILYSKDIPVDKNYVTYMQEKGKNFKWQDLFAAKEYKNADTTLPYRIYVPFNYSEGKKLPVLVNLHGASHRGNDNTSQLAMLNHIILNEELEVTDAIIICPQCPEGEKWVDTSWGSGSYDMDSIPESNEQKAVVELVQQIMQEYPVDENRIYACGYSMGGYGTWNLLMRHGDLFAAGIPMCSAGDPSKAEQLKDIPIWAVHGAKDPTVPVQGSRDMAQALEGAPNFHYTELADNEHDVWTYTYTNTEIFTWLFSQKKA